MTPRKKNADPMRQPKARPASPKPPATSELAALFMVGEEPIAIDHEENDNITFMAEVIDTD
ncbi:hypothetical protein [Duganella callida]|uniref:Uncharacterized protein n=1 Tax=Duganella callida TaxID=2561932 RepID=A0A4Y9SCP2_9BURK|nr:hypothetical protein [Duganella callida]TFW20217.1 hypothetical protein E4L98_15115 [Duganella callida]